MWMCLKLFLNWLPWRQTHHRIVVASIIRQSSTMRNIQVILYRWCSIGYSASVGRKDPAESHHQFSLLTLTLYCRITKLWIQQKSVVYSSCQQSPYARSSSTCLGSSFSMSNIYSSSSFSSCSSQRQQYVQDCFTFFPFVWWIFKTHDKVVYG